MRRIKWHVWIVVMAVFLTSHPALAQELSNVTVLDEEVTAIEEVIGNNEAEELDSEEMGTDAEIVKPEDVTSGEDEVVILEEEEKEEETEEDQVEEEKPVDPFADLLEVTVANGYYRLVTYPNNSICADIRSFSDADGAVAQIYTQAETFAQCFYIAQKDNGYYTIQNMSSRKMLTAETMPATVGTGVQQFSASGSANQEFKFYLTENGSYVIRSNAGENLVLDVTGGKVQNGTKLQLYRYNGTVAQQFLLKQWNLPGIETDIKEAVYRIYPAYAPNVTLDVSGGSVAKGANIQIYTSNLSIAQEWRIVKEGEWYRIISEKSDMCVDISGGSRAKGTNIQQWTLNTGNGQLYRFYKTGDNQYCIMSKLGTVMDCANGSLTTKTNVQAYTSNNTQAQMWGLEEILVPARTEAKVVPGYYYIRNNSREGMQLAIENGSTEVGAKANLSSQTSGDEQVFALEKQQDEWYLIRNLKTGKYLEVSGGNKETGVSLVQTEENSTNAQKFKFFDAGDGFCYLKSRQSVFVESDANGNVYTNDITFATNQKWSLTATMPESTEIEIKEDDYVFYSYVGNNQVIDIANGSKENSANVQSYKYNGTMAQNFHIAKCEDGWYTIRNNASKLYLDVADDSMKAEANVQQYALDESDAQKFKFYDGVNGTVYIKSKLGMFVEICNESAESKTNIWMNEFTGSSAQKWTLKQQKRIPINEWAYKNGYKFYYNGNGEIVKDVRNIIGKQDSYTIKVNKKMNTVTVYAKDGDNGYIIPVVAFVCSTGNATPTGTFSTPAKFRWLELMGPSWGQWCTQIVDDFLFHSVYYNSYNNNMTLAVGEYNKLGTTCSHGCIRLTAGDAKWIYDNCKLKTKVTIYNSSDAGPFGKPKAMKLSSSHTWDPTDPVAYKKCQQQGCH